MHVIGLTGKTGAGKSTVSQTLKEHGCYIIDGDVVAREILEPGSDVLLRLAEVFGEDIIKYNGELDRKLLAARAFESREKTDELNSITHPEIRKRVRAETEKAREEGFECCVIDAAAILDSDCREDCEKIAVVFAPFEVRLKRIIERDNISVTDAKKRAEVQKSDEFYLSNADIIIINDGEADYGEEVNKLLNFISRLDD